MLNATHQGLEANCQRAWLEGIGSRHRYKLTLGSLTQGLNRFLRVAVIVCDQRRGLIEARPISVKVRYVRWRLGDKQIGVWVTLVCRGHRALTIRAAKRTT